MNDYNMYLKIDVCQALLEHCELRMRLIFFETFTETNL